MYKLCVLKSEDVTFPDVVLSDGKASYVGRSPTTKIKDLRCSKRQLELTPDFQNGTVRVLHTGSNDSEVGGKRLKTKESVTVGNGDKLQLLRDKYEYTVLFEPDKKRAKYSDLKEVNSGSDDEHVEQSRAKLDQMKSSLTNYFKPTVKDSKSASKPNPSGSSSWTENVPGKLFHFKTPDCQSGAKIAAFDIDGTIITTKSGRVFPTNISDWRILLPEIIPKLKKLLVDGYQIVLFTNQKGISRGNLKPEDFKQKLEGISKSLSVPLQALVSSGSGIYRKPLRGMWDYYVENLNEKIKVDIDNSFYVGDAAGRPADWEPKRKKDFSCSDRLFALNCQLKFFTPEEYFLKQKEAKYNMPTFDPKSLNGPLAVRTKPSQQVYSENEICQPQEVIVFVGYPGAGKSFFAKKYLVSKGYIHVNRDKLGSWQKCQAMCDSALSKGSSVVIDNTNPDKESRKRYLELADKHKVKSRCFLYNCDVHQAEHNIVFRELTGSNHAKVNIMVLNSYKSKFEEPKISEGFKEIVQVNFVPSFTAEKDEKLYKMYLT